MLKRVSWILFISPRERVIVKSSFVLTFTSSIYTEMAIKFEWNLLSKIWDTLLKFRHQRVSMSSFVHFGLELIDLNQFEHWLQTIDLTCGKWRKMDSEWNLPRNTPKTCKHHPFIFADQSSELTVQYAIKTMVFAMNINELLTWFFSYLPVLNDWVWIAEWALNVAINSITWQAIYNGHLVVEFILWWTLPLLQQ